MLVGFFIHAHCLALHTDFLTLQKKKKRSHENARSNNFFFLNLYRVFSFVFYFTMSSSKLLVQRLSEFAQVPTRGSVLAAGYDLYW